MNKEKKVEDELHSFPSYLKSRTDCRTLTKRKLQQITDRIKPELETYDNDVQILRELNLLAFLHHELGNEHEALRYISESLSKKPRNINALVLKSWFSLKASDIHGSEKILPEIKTSCEDLIEVCHAKAELAYIYTRLGVSFYDKAEDTFNALFVEIETGKVTVDPNVMFIWKFGLTLIRKRTLNFHNLTEDNKFEITIERISQEFKNSIELLSIYQLDNKSRARLLVEIGELVNSANWKMPKRFRRERSKMDIFKRPATEYFKEALTYSDADPFVLNRCGKHYKLNPKTVQKAIALLEKSISIRETSFAYHHLALSLKKQVEINLRSNKFSRAGKQQHDVKYTCSTNVSDLSTSPQGTRDSNDRNYTSAAKCQNTKARTDDVVVNTEKHPELLQYGNTVHTKIIPIQATGRSTMESSSGGTTSNTEVDVGTSRSADLGNTPYDDLASAFESMNINPRRRGSYSSLMHNQSQSRGRYGESRDIASYDRYTCTRPFNSYEGYYRQTRSHNKRFTRDMSQPRGRSARRHAMVPMSDLGRNNWYRRPSYSYQGRGRQRQGHFKRFTGDITDKCDQTRITKQYVKSPSEIKYLDGADADSINTILEHLDKAFKLSGNMSALYDKGLVLRALRRYDEAIDAFKGFFGNVSAPSLVLLANAYEQSALCLRDTLELLPQSEKTEKMNYNLKHYLHASIEICYIKIMPKCPNLQYCWSSQQILENMLQKNDKTKENLSELHELYSKIQMYAKDNTLLSELLELEKDKENRNVLYIEKIKNDCKLENYDDAILTSSLMGNQMNDEPLFLEIHIEGGFQSYIKDENELAKLRFRSSLDKCRSIHTDVDDENEDTFQVFILCSETNEDLPQCLKSGLEKLGLDVTVNFENLLREDLKSTGIVKVMERSTHFIVFFEQKITSGDLNEIQHYRESIRQICNQRKYGNMVVVKRDEHVEVPINFAHIPFVIYDNDAENAPTTQKLTEKQMQSLKGLLKKLVGIQTTQRSEA